MQNENEVLQDNLATRIEEATTEELQESGLSDRVTVAGVEQKVESDRYAVGLRHRIAVQETKFLWFYIEPPEVITVIGGRAITTDDLKPFIRRELQMLFP